MQKAHSSLLVLKRIVDLCVRHRAGVEPYVNKVELAVHRLSGRAHQHDIVDIGAMKVDLLVVFLRIVAGHEAAVAVRIALHHTGLYSLIDLIVERGNRVDTYLLGAVGPSSGCG